MNDEVALTTSPRPNGSPESGSATDGAALIISSTCDARAPSSSVPGFGIAQYLSFQLGLHSAQTVENDTASELRQQLVQSIVECDRLTNCLADKAIQMDQFKQQLQVSHLSLRSQLPSEVFLCRGERIKVDTGNCYSIRRTSAGSAPKPTSNVTAAVFRGRVI